VVETYLALLASAPDTLIARKLGPEAAGEVTAEARAVQAAGGTRSAAGCAALAQFDSRLRDAHNTRNPGTTADLTAAALFVVMAEDGWSPDDIEEPRAQ
jgi:triphosphoribosyl-dephospho-CoA synthase